MNGLQSGGFSYNDGKIKFTIDYARPAAQSSSGADNNSAIIAGLPAQYTTGNQIPTTASSTMWSFATADPILNIQAVQQYMYDTYGVMVTRAITSRRVLNSILNSNRFAARSGLAVASGGTTIDPKYLIDGWGPLAAQAVVEQQTGLTFIEYDAVFRTRPIGSNTVTNNRFTLDNTIIFLPDESQVAEFDDTEIGFARTLTSPHPEGLWQPGYYEWERETVDPWGYDVGTGVKAFPVFGHAELTFVMQVL
jgi:hypothetical protein